LQLVVDSELETIYTRVQLANALDFSRAGFYYQYRMDIKDELIREKIDNLYKIDDTLGPKKLSVLLSIGKNRCQRIMDKYDLHPRKVKSNGWDKPGKAHIIFPNLLLENEGSEKQEGKLFFSDMFEFKLVDSTTVYGCFILKHLTRQVISLIFDYTKDATLLQAVINNSTDFLDKGDILHLDQVRQQSEKEVMRITNELAILISMSRAGTPTDNPFAERFVGIFKLAVVHRQPFLTMRQVLDRALKWINFYNETRPHESLNQMSPNNYAKQVGEKNGSVLRAFFVCEKMGS